MQPTQGDASLEATLKDSEAVEKPSKKSVNSALPHVFVSAIDDDAAKSKLTGQFPTLKKPPPPSTLHKSPPSSTLKSKFPALKKAPPSSTLHKLPLLPSSPRVY